VNLSNNEGAAIERWQPFFVPATATHPGSGTASGQKLTEAWFKEMNISSSCP